MQCKGRYTKEKNGLKFPTKGFYFTEKRCGEIATQDELCNECLEKRKKTIVKDELNYTPKYQQYSFQGKVDEDYYENSWIYGSPRYLKWAGIDGNTLKPKELAVAEAAQRIARGTLEMKVKVPNTEAKKGGRSKKNGTVVSTLPGPAATTTEISTPPPVPVAAAPVVEQKPKPTPKPKKVVKKTVPVPIPQIAKAVEVAEEPLEAIEVIKIQLVPKIIADKSYWYDSSKDKVYDKPKDGMIGKYLGRYDSREQALVSFPDSDVE
jgi:hypothetical protein